MMEFILSKINLLILLIALFSIISYFTQGVSTIVTIQESQSILDRMSKVVYALVNSPTYCDSIYYYLPRSIKVIGKNTYYVLKISQQPFTTENEEGEDETFNYVIFSLLPKNDQKSSLAANSFKTRAEVVFVDTQNDVTVMEGQDDFLLLDPQAADPSNAFVAVKQVKEGKSTLYIVGCQKDADICSARKQRASEVIFGLTPGEEGGFAC